VDITRPQKKRATKEHEHLEKRSGARNGGSRLEEDRHGSSRQKWMEKVVCGPCTTGSDKI